MTLTTDRNCRLRFELNGAKLGEIVAAAQDSVTITVQVEDPDAGDTLARVEILADGVVIKTLQPQGTKVEETLVAQPAPGAHYYYVRVVQTDGQKLWSAPIWVTTK